MVPVGRLTAGLLALCVWVAVGGSPAAQNVEPRGPIGALTARARAGDPVRVIVRLRLPVQPEATLGGPQPISTQRAAIAASQQRLSARLGARGRAGLKRFATVPFVALEASAADLAELASNPEVAFVFEDVPVPPTLAQSTPLVGATAMHALNYRGDGWTVAILDTGVDATHPFLGGRVISQACYSSTIGSFQSLCPGGVNASTDAGSARACTGFSGCDHGTHVAGIAAGAGSSFNGVAPEAGIIAIQIFSATYDTQYCGSPCVLSFTSDQMLGLERVYALLATYRIAAVNMSLGGGWYMGNCDGDPRKPLIDQLRAAGTATVIAAGNNGFSNAVSAPACISSAVSVGSTGDGGAGSPSADSVSYFSNSASFLNLLAPGHYITSSVPGGGFASFAGTSMATPHVAGAFAVLKGRNPAATVDEILAALASGGVSVTDPRNGVTTPRINVDGARAYLSVGCTLTVGAAPAGAPSGGYSGTVSVTAPPGCAWRATSASAGLTITSGGAGVGSGTLSYSLTPNTSTALRSLTLQFREGEIVVTQVITQAGVPTVAGDLSGDSRPDLIWQNDATGALSLWVMEGTTLRDTPSFAPASADPGRKLVGAADIDGDGHGDLIFQNAGAGTIETWLMNGGVRVSVQTIGPVMTDPAWQVVGTGDFNADGRVDLALRHAASGALGVWFLNGTTRIGAGLMTPGSVDPAWKIRGVGDFNRDNKPDLMWQHTSGALAVWFMDGITVQDTRYLSIPSVGDPAWEVAGVADMNGDLRSDIIWQHKTGGWIAVWFLWNNTVLDTAFFNPNRVADVSWRLAGPK